MDKLSPKLIGLILSFRGLNYYNTSLVCSMWKEITYKVRDPSARNEEALLKSCYHNYFESVKMLLKDPRVNPAHNGQAAFTIAAQRGHHRIVKLLLKDGRIDSFNQNIVTRRAIEALQFKVIEVITKHRLKKLGLLKKIEVIDYDLYNAKNPIIKITQR
jgi:ankyrin repeat protein